MQIICCDVLTTKVEEATKNKAVKIHLKFIVSDLSDL